MADGASFVKHEPCYNCGSKNNVGVWSDGSKYCFGCRWKLSHHSLSIKDLKQQLDYQEKQKDKKYANLSLPSDFSYNLPPTPLAWLKKYGLTDKEIYQHRFGWSQERGILIYPAFDSYGNLLLYQGRVFTHPNPLKYDSRGNMDSVDCIFGTSDNCIVCTEDVVSAIKVSRLLTSICLFGSILSINRIRRLSDRFKRLVIWLDKDKQQYALKARFRAMPYFDNVSVIVTDLDPKEYKDYELKTTLAPYL